MLISAHEARRQKEKKKQCLNKFQLHKNKIN